MSRSELKASDLCYAVVEDHDTDGLRAGEGSIVTLTDGRLLMFYTHFTAGGGDADPARIASRVSADGGMTWSIAVPQFLPPEGALNTMAASLLRLQDGRIGCVFLVKWSETRLTPMWTCSDDEGGSWSSPAPLTQESKYFCVNNDRLVELSDGTLVLPYARLGDSLDIQAIEFDERWNLICGLFFSLDQGATWQRSPHEITYCPEFFTPPFFESAAQQRPDMAYQLQNRLGVFQEPGVQQLADGSLMLYMRSSYCIYRCFARTVISEWTDCSVFPGLNVCCGPQTIRRLPESGNLLMFYNDRGALAWGDPGFRDRTPLSVAISRDEGQTWQRWGQLEGDSRNYCYFSLLFFEDRFITSYYESGQASLPGKPARRNLASLKVCTGSWEIFERDSPC